MTIYFNLNKNNFHVMLHGNSFEAKQITMKYMQIRKQQQKTINNASTSSTSQLNCNFCLFVCFIVNFDIF